ncbi:prepilin-type N-terminal cleavage/methylation domain-containing protein [Marinobacterium aestuariivivens]|uniref:Prepilin-type N-terminal cleavage/methylation domain-containing protein n=1 Tax=Marinobacterium aestuariivivens TaxID=1698799 RepID=A0ABW1ZV13_9GAMM
MIRQPTHRMQGFTLVELMIALLLTGMVAMLVFGAFRIATGSWERVVSQQERVHERYLVQTFVRRLLEQAQPLRLRDIDARLSVAMHGDREQLIFVTELPTRNGVAEFYWCQLRVKETETQLKQLIMTTRPYTEGEIIDWLAPFEPTGEGLNGEEIPFTEPEERVLLEGVAELEFEYLYYDQTDQPEWRREWVEESVLPYLIRFQVLPQDEDGLAGEADTAFWPELLVSPTEYRYGGKTLL